MEEWAARADNPREWRASIIQMAQQDPKDLLSHQRGQVAHVLRSVKGTKIFSEAQPSPHAEWVCVMDANVRSADAAQCYGDNAETFDPKHAYGLDDDLDELADEDRRRGSGTTIFYNGVMATIALLTPTASAAGSRKGMK